MSGILIAPQNEMKVGDGFYLKITIPREQYQDKDFVALFMAHQDDDAYGDHWYGIRPDRIGAGGFFWEGKFGPWDNGVYEFRLFRQDWRAGPIYRSAKFTVGPAAPDPATALAGTLASLDSTDDVKSYLGKFATKIKLEEAEVKELQLLFKRTDGTAFRALSQSDLLARIATKSPPLDVEVAQLLWQHIAKDIAAAAPTTSAVASGAATPAAPAAAVVVAPAPAAPVITPSTAYGKQTNTHLVVATEGKFVPKADEDDCEDILAPYRAHAGTSAGFMFADSEGKAIVDAITAKLTRSGKKFVDMDFPPNKASLNRRPADEAAQVGNERTVFRRASQWMKAPCVFSPDGVSVDDINQGSLGDCWLCAGIAAIGTRPDIVENMIYPKMYNPAGVYAVRLMRRKVWQWMLLDDYFPVNETGDERWPIFISSKNPNEMWSMMLEKTQAKNSTCYQDVGAGGWGHYEPLPAYSGGVFSIWCVEDDKQPSVELVWSRVKEYMSKRWLMTGDGRTDNRAMGVVGGHAYSIIGYVEVGKIRLIKVRNTWGSFEWKGAWGDESPEWGTHPAVKAAAKWEQKNDGIFFITPEDYLQKGWSGGFRCCRLDGVTPGKPDSVMDDKYCWADPPPRWSGGDKYGVNNTWSGTWKGDNSGNAQETAVSAQIAFNWNGPGPLSIRARLEGETKGGYPYLSIASTVDTPDARASRGVGRVHEQDKGAKHMLNDVSFEWFDLDLAPSALPYVLLPRASAPQGTFKVEVKCGVELKMYALPTSPMVMLRGEWKGASAAGPYKSENPQFKLVVPERTQVHLSCTITSKWDLFDNKTKPYQTTAIYWASGSRLTEIPYTSEIAVNGTWDKKGTLSAMLDAGTFVVCVTNHQKGLEGSFDLSVITDRVMVQATALQ